MRSLRQVHDSAVTAPDITPLASTLEELLIEYFRLKNADKAIRKVRNEFMSNPANTCTAEDKQLEGECIHQTRGMGGYPAPLCSTCEIRNNWYAERMEMSRKRGQIMRRLKRLVDAEQVCSNTYLEYSEDIDGKDEEQVRTEKAKKIAVLQKEIEELSAN